MNFPNASFPIINISVLSPESLGYMIAGQIGGTGSNGTAWPAANLAMYIPFSLRRKITVSKMFVGNGTPAGSVDLGIYSIDGAKLASTGSTAMSGSTAMQRISLSATVTLGPGMYYMAIACNGATTTLNCKTATASYYLKSVGIYEQTTAFPLPSTATFATCTRTLIPWIGLTGITN